MAVHLTRIYTRTGDDGTTALGDFSRVAKTDPRLAAYADTDEANAAIGVVLAVGGPVRRVRRRAAPGAERALRRGRRPEHPDRGRATHRLRITEDYVQRLEAACDEFNQRTGKLDSFILPGGTPAAAYLHVARTVARRAERSVWALSSRLESDASPDRAPTR